MALSQLPGVDKLDVVDEEQRLVQMSSVIPMDCINLVCCVGVLLKYLEKHRVGAELEDLGGQVPILAIRSFTL